VRVELLEETLLELSCGQNINTAATLYLCRDRTETIQRNLKPESLVVLSAKRHWWRTVEERLAKQLTQDGHRVVILST
jgi:uncharacterized lipoprotein YajG